MKKSLLAMTALAAMLFAGCTSSDEITTLESIKQAENAPAPISFGTYMGKTGTRAVPAGGYVGNMTTSTLQSGADYGFGVFAYYTSSTAWNSLVPKIQPNFMYNQQVYYDASKWTYSPIKYWPNDNATADNAGATGNGASKVSFFAYAPYTNAASSTGITGFSANTNLGDPWVTYALAGNNDGQEVDLLWGTADESLNINGTTQGNGTPTGILSGYKVNIDMTKQKTNETVSSSDDNRVKFNFKHALAMFGGNDNSFTIIADIDNAGAVSGGSFEVVGGKKNTKVTLKSIRIENSTDKLKKSGKFHLETGVWDDLTGELVFNVARSYDDATQYLNASIIEPDASTVSGWKTTWSDTEYIKADAAQNIFATGKAPQFFFIPGTTPKFDITVCYVVRTQDSNLADKFTEIEQTIKKTVTFGAAAALNKKYGLAIHLGLTTVKFTATVSDWDNADASPSSPTQVDLPINVANP